MTTAKEWKKAQDAKLKARKDLTKAMTPEQRKAVDDLLDTAWDVLQTAHECQDLWMSQIGKLEGALWMFQSLVRDRDEK